MGFYDVVFTNPRSLPKRLTPTVVEMQLLPKIEKTDYKEESFGLKWTI